MTPLMGINISVYECNKKLYSFKIYHHINPLFYWISLQITQCLADVVRKCGQLATYSQKLSWCIHIEYVICVHPEFLNGRTNRDTHTNMLQWCSWFKSQLPHIIGLDRCDWFMTLVEVDQRIVYKPGDHVCEYV